MENSNNIEVEIFEEDGFYTVIDSYGNIFVMNKSPLSPQKGVNQYEGKINRDCYERDNFGEKVSMSEVPEEVKEAIHDRCSD